MARREEHGLGRALGRIAPGLPGLLRYDFAADSRHDLLAGLSVAAVALPVAVAYAELAGFDPVVGLYSCILPLVVYAIFGTSRQLMVNPDAATCAMVAAAVAPLAGGDREVYLSLSVTLAFLTGLFCIAASFMRLGALADFLSKPILVGFLNGVAIDILLGQIGKIFGFPIESGRIVPRLAEFVSKLPQTHWPTLAVGLGALGVLILSRKFLRRLPSALVAMAAGGVAVAVLGLEGHGVAILGRVPAGFPPLRLPEFPAEDLAGLTASAAGLALVLFSSGMLTARSFADKNRYEINVDREFAAFGMANIASAVSQGFAVTGAASRTAMGESSGGRTQVTGLVAAATIAAVLLFFTEPLQYVPVPALGAVLVFAAFSLLDARTPRLFWKLDRTEVMLSVLTTLGVVAFGAINAILVAVGLALVRFVQITARPRVEILGQVGGLPGLHSIERHPGATTWPGILIFRFNSPIVFFNAPYFKQRILQAAEAAGPELKWVVVDMVPVSRIDVTGAFVLRDVRLALEARGLRLVFAGRKTEITERLRRAGLYSDEMNERMFPTLRQALKAFREQFGPAEAAPQEE